MSREEQIQLVQQWQQTQDSRFGEQLWEMILCQIEGTLKGNAKKLGLNQDIQDILQETFIDFSTNVLSGKFRPEGNAKPSTYVFRIASNNMASEVRRKTRETRAAEKIVNEVHKSKVDNPVQQAIEHDNVYSCIEMLKAIKEPMRTVFCLRVGIRICQGTVVDDIRMYNQEIEKLFGKSRGWASKQYTEARKTLHRVL